MVRPEIRGVCPHLRKGKDSTTQILIILFLSNQKHHTRPAMCWLNQIVQYRCSYFPVRFLWARKLWILMQLHLY